MGVYLGKNAVKVYGGGVKVKPEEEKTVTASTSTIEVTPTSGMTLNKVIVNPIPSEVKLITPSTRLQIVTPSEGKLISKVKVSGDSDLIPANIKQGVNIFGVDGKTSVIDTEDTAILKADENFNNLINSTIGNAIRNKNGTAETMTLDEMVTAIESMNLGASIEKGSFTPASDIYTKKITWSKTYDTPPVLFVYDTTYSNATSYGDRHRCGYIINFKVLGWNTFMGQSSYNDLGHIISSWESSPWSSASMPAPIGWLTKSGGTLGSTDQINVSNWKWASGWTYKWIAVFL